MGRKNHSRRTDATLRAPAFQKGFLKAIQLRARCQSFDRNDVRTLGLKDRYEAAIYQRAVQQHGAGAALAFATSLFSTGQSQLVP